jgi:hypothetical protein
MGHPVIRLVLTAAFAALYYLIYFQAIGPALNWAPWPGVPAPTGPTAGPYFLMVILIGAAGFGSAELVKLDARAGYMKKPKVLVQT